MHIPLLPRCSRTSSSRQTLYSFPPVLLLTLNQSVVGVWWGRGAGVDVVSAVALVEVVAGVELVDVSSFGGIATVGCSWKRSGTREVGSTTISQRKQTYRPTFHGTPQDRRRSFANCTMAIQAIAIR